MNKPKVVKATVTVLKNVNPLYDKKEFSVEVHNDNDDPVEGAELVEIGLHAIATGATRGSGKGLPAKTPALPATAEQSAAAPVGKTAKEFAYNLELVPIEKRVKAKALLDKAKARYWEERDLWVVVGEELPQLAKYLVS